jgi:hypothetical protein
MHIFSTNYVILGLAEKAFKDIVGDRKSTPREKFSGYLKVFVCLQPV